MLLIGVLGIEVSSHAQQPPDVVQSDKYANTAMGTSALYSLMSGASSNTAAGYLALRDNTLGSFNSAYGNSTLSFNTVGNGNTGIGAGALEYTTSSDNTALGFSALGSNTTGSDNTAVGMQALLNNTTGAENVADGMSALWSNTTGSYNTVSGFEVLYTNTTGSYNTASGTGALFYNTTGNTNAASGINALACNTSGSYNSAFGPSALSGGTYYRPEIPSPLCPVGYATGDGNTASGAQALTNNTEGFKNTASGYLALTSNTTGSYNTASGYQALYSNATGIRNTADGDWALYSNTGGNDNTASGQGALNKTIGSHNIGLGADAGFNVTSGYYNIEIGNEGTSSDNGMIRIGAAGSQTATFIAGISNAQVTGAAVYVTSSGQLGVLASSERYKIGIRPMGENSSKLQRLRPVSFHLRSDPTGAVQYGLIAEEVDKIYPELVIRDDSGKIQGVRYDELAPMLVHEVQKQAAEIRNLKRQRVRYATRAELQDLKEQLQAALRKLQAQEELLAQRSLGRARTLASATQEH